MIQSSDIQGRLRLFRYGLVVIVVVTFLISLLAPYVITAAYANEINQVATAVNATPIEITVATFLGQALLTTLVVAVLMVVAYMAYRSFLLRSAPTVSA